MNQSINQSIYSSVHSSSYLLKTKESQKKREFLPTTTHHPTTTDVVVPTLVNSNTYPLLTTTPKVSSRRHKRSFLPLLPDICVKDYFCHFSLSLFPPTTLAHFYQEEEEEEEDYTNSTFPAFLPYYGHIIPWTHLRRPGPETALTFRQVCWGCVAADYQHQLSNCCSYLGLKIASVDSSPKRYMYVRLIRAQIFQTKRSTIAENVKDKTPE